MYKQYNVMEWVCLFNFGLIAEETLSIAQHVHLLYVYSTRYWDILGDK